MYEISRNAKIPYLVLTLNCLKLRYCNVTLGMDFSEDKLALYDLVTIDMVIVLILSHVMKKAKMCCWSSIGLLNSVIIFAWWLYIKTQYML